MLASANQGKPGVAATGKAGQLSAAGVVAAREAGKVHAPTNPAALRTGTGQPAGGPGKGERKDVKATPASGAGSRMIVGKDAKGPPAQKSAKATPPKPPKSNAPQGDAEALSRRRRARRQSPTTRRRKNRRGELEPAAPPISVRQGRRPCPAKSSRRSLWDNPRPPCRPRRRNGCNGHP